MHSRTAARRLALSSRTAARQSVPRHGGVRYNASTAGASSSTSASASQQMSPFVAAVVGGGVVLAGALLLTPCTPLLSKGYGYYHFSGTRALVQTAQSVQSTLKSAKDTAFEKAPAPNEVIQFLRSTAKSYASFFPGASSYVDASFDAIDRLEQTHRKEVDAIVKRTYDELREITKNGGVDAQTAQKVYDVLKRQSAELAEVAKKAANDVIQPVLDKHPEVKEKLGGGWTQIQESYQSLKDTDLAQEAQKIYDDTSSQLVDLFKSGFSATSLVKAKTLLDEKAQQISELSQKAGKELYEKGQEEYLKNAPEELKKFFSDDETMKSILGSGAGTASVVAVWNKVKEVGEKGKWDDKGVQDVKDFVQQKIEEAKKKGGPQFDAAWSAAQGWLKSVPGGEKALETAKDIDISSLSKIATSKSEDAKKLLEETYSDVLSVLKEKSEKAKKLAEGAKEDAEKGSSKSGQGKKDEKKDEKDEKKDDKKGGEKGKKGRQ
ncbi:hypothetical protein FRC04_002927 [Tulasnella sp. 424]|nr:hypothetical protein FRC04_002927 [Tulasnella sp. 424]KAG8966962.1 hypothetical protein FRC05_002338 [Tulasnella sp. 425]